MPLFRKKRSDASDGQLDDYVMKCSFIHVHDWCKYFDVFISRVLGQDEIEMSRVVTQILHVHPQLKS